MSSLERLLDPRGIAIVGATADVTRSGGQIVRALVEYGYAGGVYPINPRHAQIAGRTCYASLADIDGPCDVAVIALPAPQVPAVIEQCGKQRIPFAVVIGSGFRESGAEGARIEAQMLAAARRGGVRFIGPNGLGLVNVHAHAFAGFGSITRPPQPQPGAVSAVIQSGGFGNALVIRCALAGIGFRYVVASGNESDIAAPELIEAYVDDPGTHVILAYLEGVADGRAFMRAARRALAAGKPIVAWKAGNTRQGLHAAASHTANMTGTYDMYRAAFRQCGVIEVHDVDQTSDVIRCLLAGRLPKGRDVALIGGSGGSAVVFSDAADEVGLDLPPLGDETMKVIGECLPSIGSIRNPIDYTAGNPRAEARSEFARAFEAVLADPNIDQLAVMFATAFRDQVHIGADILSEAARHCDKPIVVFSVMPDDIAPEGMEILRQAKIPVLRSPARVARAMALLADYAEALQRNAGALAASPDRGDMAHDIPLPALPPGAVTLDEHESKQLLAAAGISVTRDVLLPVDNTTLTLKGREQSGLSLQTFLSSEHMVFPVAVKIVSRDIAHKTDIGAVRLGVSNAAELGAAAAELIARARHAAPQARLAGVLASEMIADGVEVIVGVVNAKGFGPVVACGLGGVLAETLRDMSYRIAPFRLDDAHAMIGELKGRAVLDGLRGRPKCDVAALANTLVRVSELAWQMRERLDQMDINPLMVRPEGRGVVAADALIVLR